MPESTVRNTLAAKLLGRCADMTAADRRNLYQATWWLAGWAVVYVGAAQLLKRGGVPSGAATALVALVPSVFAVVAILAYIRFIRRAEELQRKIQVEALALGFGAGFVASFGLEMLGKAGLVEAEVSTAFLVMILFYVAGIWLGGRRYA